MKIVLPVVTMSDIVGQTVKCIGETSCGSTFRFWKADGRFVSETTIGAEATDNCCFLLLVADGSYVVLACPDECVAEFDEWEVFSTNRNVWLAVTKGADEWMVEVLKDQKRHNFYAISDDVMAAFYSYSFEVKARHFGFIMPNEMEM